MDKITKLSQAIRLGATFRPQCVGATFSTTLGDSIAEAKSCAIGAASEALGISGPATPEIESVIKMSERFNLDQGVFYEIVRRNDYLRQTREEIADWLEQQGL